MTTIRLILNVPDLPDAVTVEVPRGTSVLLGREPDPAKLPASDGAGARAELRTVTLASQRVSANHLLVEHRAEGLFVSDLHSRNGSWLRLVPGRDVRLRETDLALDLARSLTFTPSDEGPDDADWVDVRDFAVGVRASVQQWLQRQNLHARVSLRHQDAEPDNLPTFGLPDGSLLVVHPDVGATLTSGWLDRVRAYVHEQNVAFEQTQGHDENFVMASPEFRRAHRQVVEAALRGQRLVILGDTGSGKEMLAECYHRHSARGGGPFRVVNCGVWNNVDMARKELFGAVRGAHSDLVRDVQGAVEAANGGTLLLDELGEMPLDIQVLMLRFLDRKGEYHRLGEMDKVRHVDVRVASATNRDPEQLIDAKRLRLDLWSRIAGDLVRVPPLAERPADILAFLDRREVMPGLRAREVMTPDAVDFVLSQRWPGNFRELENFVGRLVSVMVNGRCDASACRRALRARSEAAPAAAVVRAEPAVLGEVWGQILERATLAWADDFEGSLPSSWSALERFQEAYVKPLFVAYMCNRPDIDRLSRELNYSEMARSLALSDGTRVKAYLSRYVERFRQQVRP